MCGIESDKSTLTHDKYAHFIKPLYFMNIILLIFVNVFKYSEHELLKA